MKGHKSERHKRKKVRDRYMYQNGGGTQSKHIEPRPGFYKILSYVVDIIYVEIILQYKMDRKKKQLFNET